MKHSKDGAAKTLLGQSFHKVQWVVAVLGPLTQIKANTAHSDNLDRVQQQGGGGGRVSHRNNVRYLNIITKCITAELFVIITLCTSVDYINTCTRKLISCFIEPEHILRCFHRTVSAVTREWIFPAAAFVWSSQMQACKSTKYRTPSQHHTVQYTARSLTGTAELDN